ncbi:MAG: hypothetical protein GTO12_12425 [Proteobacteria bacterium]|nr:hypothetical protein [Pseudomonadota bacterium]
MRKRFLATTGIYLPEEILTFHEDNLKGPFLYANPPEIFKDALALPPDPYSSRLEESVKKKAVRI